MKKAFLVLAAALTMGWGFWPQPLFSHELVSTTVTFDREIVRILNKKCIACHSENNLGVPLTSYEQTRPWARAIEEELLRRHMPPWRAVPGYGKFANDNALTNRELQFFISWIEGNGPKTKDQRLIVNIETTKTSPDNRLRLDFARWQLGTPDLLKPLAANSIAPRQPDEVRRVIVDLGLTSDQWIRALEFKPGDRRVVRAAFFSLQETGQWLGSWTPWYPLTTLPQDIAYLVPAGSHLAAEIHYQSASEPVEDRGSIGVYFAKAPAAHSPFDLIVGTRAEGPGQGVSDPRRQKFSGSVTLPDDVNVVALKPDVPIGVESVEVSAQRPNGTVQMLLLVRNVLPEWPTPYILNEPLRLPRNTKLRVTYYYKSAAAEQSAPELKLTASVYTITAPIATTH